MRAKIIGTCRTNQDATPLHRYGNRVIDRAGKVSTELLFETVSEAYKHIKWMAKDYHYQYGEMPPKELKQAYKDNITMMGSRIVGVTMGDCEWELVTSYVQQVPRRRKPKPKLSAVSWLFLKYLQHPNLMMKDFTTASKMEQEQIIEAYNQGEAENWDTDPNKAANYYTKAHKIYKP